VKTLTKRALAATTIGAAAVAGIAIAAQLQFQAVISSSPGNVANQGQFGRGLIGSAESAGTFYFDRFMGTTDPAFPSLHAYTDLPGPAAAFRAESTEGIDALVGDTPPDLENEYAPDFTVDPYPSLHVADDGPMNTAGAVNNQTEVNRVAADLRGALKLCGKSAVSEDECTNQAYLYLEDGTGNLVVKFGNGNGFVIASVASAAQPFTGSAIF